METTENATGKSGGFFNFKNISLIVLGAAVLGTGYLAFDQYHSKEVMKANYEKQEMIDAEEMNQSISTIEQNLAEISKKEGYVFKTGEAGIASTEQKIYEEIIAIENVLAKNREMIKNLSTIVGEKDKKIVAYNKSIAALEKKLADYKTRVQSLSDETVALNNELEESKLLGASLYEELEDNKVELKAKDNIIGVQTVQISNQEKELNTAYYVVGTYKNLKENDVVDKEGGFIGLASAKTLKTDFDRDMFTKIDIYSYTSIPVFSKGAEIITNHSSDSYEVVTGDDGMIQWINIKNPQKFWASSKYLVVVIKSDWKKDKTHQAGKILVEPFNNNEHPDGF